MDRRVNDPPRTILVVDDDDTCREVMRRLLERAGYRIRVAADGAAALRIADRLGDGLDVVLLDWQMPGLSGAETLRTLRRTRPWLPVIVVTGTLLDRVLADVPGPWLAGHVAKPWFCGELEAAVQDALAADARLAVASGAGAPR